MKRTACFFVALAALILLTPGVRNTVLQLGAPDQRTVHPSPADFQGYLDRAEARAAVASEVLAGRVTLLEAADSYLQILGDRAPQCLEWASGQTTREKLCRQVIINVQSLETERRLDSTVSQRLEAELARRLADEERAWRD